MKRFIRLIILDFKGMSVTSFVPVVFIALLTLYGSVMFDPWQPFLVLNMYQQLIPPLASWWVIMLFYSFVEDEGAEAFFSYGFSRKVLGTGRAATVMGAFSVLTLITCTALLFVNKYPMADVMKFYLVLLTQSWYYGGIGFLVLVMIRNMLWTFAIVMMVLYINIWGGLTEISRYLVITVEIGKSLELKDIWIKLVSTLVFSIVFFYLAQKRFNKLTFRAKK